ncbi:hypothetical protein ACIBG7_01140 [Nonomuraea sp. NPDC050328]|uniref:hypothetical protein n=1 Tax=Nonomuraea sp. NPDC050328 TaxID=3364361 RepID=UPI0037917641
MSEFPDLDAALRTGPPPPGPAIVRSVLLRAATTPVELGRGSRLGRAWHLLLAEARLMHRAVWVTGAAVMALAVVIMALQPHSIGWLLALIAPLVAGASVATLYAPEHDAAFEVVAATPTPPRVILLARVLLVLGYDLLLALAASGLSLLGGGVPYSLGELIGTWLAPMTLLAAIGLALSVQWNPEAAVAVSLGAWVLYALSHTHLLSGLPPGWRTHPLTYAVAVAMLALAVLIEPRRRLPATHGS